MKKLQEAALARAQQLKEKIAEQKRRQVPAARLRLDKQRVMALRAKAHELKHRRCVNYLQQDTQLNICALSRKIKKAKKTHPG